MPRSLVFCAQMIHTTLDSLAMMYGKRIDCHDAVAEMCHMLETTTMDDIFARGLHEFLSEFIARNNDVTDCLSDSYNFY
jgi:uncharacterized alpha-E superfamily protein